jgi:CheY-like chemotaxis protein
MSRVALVVVGNSILEGRLRNIMSRRDWSVEICHDGDKAVDEYVRLEPELVFLTLDLPTIDGHIAALEMRETDPKARIIFVSSKTRLSKTQDAAYSSGAVLTLVTPVAFSDIDEKWEEIMGDIPEAPGLPDLDALYPELEEPEPEPVLPPLPELPPLPPLPVEPQTLIEKPKKKRGQKLKLLILLTILIGSGLGIAHYLEYIDIKEFYDNLLGFFN